MPAGNLVHRSRNPEPACTIRTRPGQRVVILATDRLCRPDLLILIEKSKDPAALGSNLLGAVLGGVLEYSSIVLGLKAMALAVLGFYLASDLEGFRWSHVVLSPPS